MGNGTLMSGLHCFCFCTIGNRFSGRGLLPGKWQRRRPGIKQTQRGSHLGPTSQPQLLRKPEGGARSTEAQRQLHSHQEPRQTKLLVQSGSRTITAVSRRCQSETIDSTMSTNPHHQSLPHFHNPTWHCTLRSNVI